MVSSKLRLALAETKRQIFEANWLFSFRNYEFNDFYYAGDEKAKSCDFGNLKECKYDEKELEELKQHQIKVLKRYFRMFGEKR